MIGLSVSRCIQDMVEGLVDPEDVVKIVSGTKTVTEDEHRLVIAKYRKKYWRLDPDKGEELYRRLLAEGRIEQPRLTKPMAPNTDKGFWVETEDQIEWQYAVP